MAEHQCGCGGRAVAAARFLDELHLCEWHRNIMLADAKEATHTEHDRFDFALLADGAESRH